MAENHGRNGDWAEQAVRRASNLTEQQALRRNVIDVVAPDLPTLLRKIDGHVTIPNHYTLHTANADITYANPGFFTRLLNVLIDPNLITLLFLAPWLDFAGPWLTKTLAGLRDPAQLREDFDRLQWILRLLESRACLLEPIEQVLGALEPVLGRHALVSCTIFPSMPFTRRPASSEE